MLRKIIVKLRDWYLVNIKWKNYQFGKNFHAGKNVVLWAKNHIHIGKNVYIGRNSQIECNTTIGNDVIIGSVIGFILAIVGIKISYKFKLLSWIEDEKYYPFFIILFIVGCILIILKILEINLLIFYISLSSLNLTIFILIKSYAKKS